MKITFTPTLLCRFSCTAPLGIGLSALLLTLLLGCQPPDLSIENINDFPVRVAESWDGKIYVSNTLAGSVFVYVYDEELDELVVVEEYKDLERPLGVAVTQKRRILIGNDEQNGVEVWDRNGFKYRDIGFGNIQMPNDIVVASNGEIFIADSLGNTIWVYQENGKFVRTIGSSGTANGQFQFPSAITIAQRNGVDELYVADQGNVRIQVFSLDGTFLRKLGRRVSNFDYEWRGRFVKIQSIAVDDLGYLHVLDSYMNTIQILDSLDGTFLDYYGAQGTEPGELNLPLDICITVDGDTVVTNAGNQRTDLIHEEDRS